jgi:hypothetical protein
LLFFFFLQYTEGETVFGHIIKKDIDERRGSFPLQRRADFRGPSDLTFHTGTCQRWQRWHKQPTIFSVSLVMQEKTQKCLEKKGEKKYKGTCQNGLRRSKSSTG